MFVVFFLMFLAIYQHLSTCRLGSYHVTFHSSLAIQSYARQ